MVRLLKLISRIDPLARFARHHERDHAREIRLVGQRHQIEHQPGVLRVESGMPTGRRRQRQAVRRSLLGALNPLLDLAHVLEILGRGGPVARPEPALELGDRPARPNRGCCWSRASAASRSAGVPGRPNIRSKTTRGLISIGSGVVGVFHDIVFM